jgi:hypothetical protein
MAVVRYLASAVTELQLYTSNTLHIDALLQLVTKYTAANQIDELCKALDTHLQRAKTKYLSSNSLSLAGNNISLIHYSTYTAYYTLPYLHSILSYTPLHTQQCVCSQNIYRCSSMGCTESSSKARQHTTCSTESTSCMAGTV